MPQSAADPSNEFSCRASGGAVTVAEDVKATRLTSEGDFFGSPSGGLREIRFDPTTAFALSFRHRRQEVRARL